MAFKELLISYAPDADKTKLLCPGFTHADVAAISKTVGNNIGVSVSRADGPSNIISSKALKRENF
jgi:hypothetical protein